jgi:hypothetical protein
MLRPTASARRPHRHALAREVIADYRPLFALDDTHFAHLTDFMEKWDVLRQCCGAQMSSDWHAHLVADEGSAAAPDAAARHYAKSGGSFACEDYDVSAVERALMGTWVYRTFAPRVLIVRSLGLHDRDYDGDYCRCTTARIADEKLRKMHNFRDEKQPRTLDGAPPPPVCGTKSDDVRT